MLIIITSITLGAAERRSSVNRFAGGERLQRVVPGFTVLKVGIDMRSQRREHIWQLRPGLP
ncbi:hypothetical protein A5725_17535 [Mycobacterium kubicae]|nr:hypothetical protein A5725_17535 [Mycobacterium kubicae]